MHTERSHGHFFVFEVDFDRSEVPCERCGVRKLEEDPIPGKIKEKERKKRKRKKKQLAPLAPALSSKNLTDFGWRKRRSVNWKITSSSCWFIAVFWRKDEKWFQVRHGLWTAKEAEFTHPFWHCGIEKKEKLWPKDCEMSWCCLCVKICTRRITGGSGWLEWLSMWSRTLSLGAGGPICFGWPAGVPQREGCKMLKDSRQWVHDLATLGIPAGASRLRRSCFLLPPTVSLEELITTPLCTCPTNWLLTNNLPSSHHFTGVRGSFPFDWKVKPKLSCRRTPTKSLSSPQNSLWLAQKITLLR